MSQISPQTKRLPRKLNWVVDFLLPRFLSYFRNHLSHWLGFAALNAIEHCTLLAAGLWFGRRLTDLVEVICTGAGAATGAYFFICPLLGQLVLAPPDNGAHGQDQYERGEQTQQPDGHDLFSLVVMAFAVVALVLMTATALLIGALTAVATSVALPWAI
ncbi:MAG: hypothetical protein ACRCUH_14255, partial [Shewanella sp.]